LLVKEKKRKGERKLIPDCLLIVGKEVESFAAVRRRKKEGEDRSRIPLLVQEGRKRDELHCPYSLSKRNATCAPYGMRWKKREGEESWGYVAKKKKNFLPREKSFLSEKKKYFSYEEGGEGKRGSLCGSEEKRKCLYQILSMRKSLLWRGTKTSSVPEKDAVREEKKGEKVLKGHLEEVVEKLFIEIFLSD